MKSIKYDLPFLALRDVVVFPGNVTTLFVGREKSINALNHAMSGNKKILQRDVLPVAARTWRGAPGRRGTTSRRRRMASKFEHPRPSLSVTGA